MKKQVKKIVEVILTIIASVSFCLMFGEKADGSVCLPWSLGWLGALTISAILLGRMGAFNREESR